MTAESFKDFDYEEIKIIGRGQYGLVHLVKHLKDQSVYVCKSIDLTCLSEKERETAEQEVELLRRLDHPNIVEYKDHFFIGDTIVIAMQYCEGGDLATYIKDMARRRTRIKETHIMSWFVQILSALEYVHSCRILHRDLKTSNLFLTAKSTVVKLGDFGISRQFHNTVELANTVVGTPHYMSPEVCENKPYTFKSDVWSLGCVLYELCMLKHAFAADNLLGLVNKIVCGKYESIPPMYSANLNSLIQRMLTRNASTRPSVRALLDDKAVQAVAAAQAKHRGFGAPSSPGTQHGHRTGGRWTPVAGRAGVRALAKGGAATKGKAKQKPAVNAETGLPESTKANAAADEEYYEDDFCSDTDSEWDDADIEFGILTPVTEEVREWETMSASCSTAAATAAAAAATVRQATLNATATVNRLMHPSQEPFGSPMRRLGRGSLSPPILQGGRSSSSTSSSAASAPLRQPQVRQTRDASGFGNTGGTSRAGNAGYNWARSSGPCNK